MPYFDGTGPQGQGPMTGRGLGPCGGGSAFGRRGLGRGMTRGMTRGLGRGFGYNSYNQPNKTDAQDYIKDLEAELKDAKSYLKDLETKK